MPKQYYATNGYSYWTPNPSYREQKLALLTDGSLVVLTDMVREGWTISPLPPDYKYTEIPPEQYMLDKVGNVEKIQCPCCRGRGQIMEIVDHDRDYNAVYEQAQCDRCNGTGEVVKK